MKNKAGILWMVATTVLFVIVTAVVRYLGSEMHPIQAAFLRYAFGVVLIIPFCLRASLFRIPFSRLRLHALRGVAHGIAIMLWFFAMMRLPIAEVTALSFMTPVFIIIGASVFLKERFYRHRAIAVALGIAGGLIILQPGFRAIDLGAIAQLVAAPLFAVSMLIAKNLTRNESNGHILLMLSVFCTLTLTLPAIAIWRQPTLEELSWLFLCAFFFFPARVGIRGCGASRGLGDGYKGQTTKRMVKRAAGTACTSSSRRSTYPPPHGSAKQSWTT